MSIISIKQKRRVIVRVIRAERLDILEESVMHIIDRGVRGKQGIDFV